MNEFYLQRHFKLWEDNNKLLNRIVFLTVVLSLALVIKVLIPFVDFSEDKKPVIQAIETLNVEKETTDKKIETIRETKKVLVGVNEFISRKPWQDEKRDLIKRYKDMRDSPPAEGYPRKRYQQEADNTINKIAGVLHKNIFTPLQQSTDGMGTDSANPDVLTREVKSLDQFIIDWKKEYINKNWYRTIGRKDTTMHELTASLNLKLNSFSNVVKSELVAVNRAKFKLDSELKVLNKKIVTEADKLKVLDDELQKILPEWLRGLVKIEQVIQLLPVALFGAAVFVLALGMSLTRHYNVYTSGNELTKHITADPGMSTTWTLIYRGSLGSLLTIAAYTLFVLFAWLLFEKSMLLLLEWLAIDPSGAWVSSHEFWVAFLWLCRAGFVLLLAYILTGLRGNIYADD
ncbi:MAG: hypothetical protein KAT61_03440 [Gammaproteobacteria bacterium]|nr:hypothetical protein [Gammaproteobacteria bacterium]